MTGAKWLHLWCGGLLLGLLRGCVEVYRLQQIYPVNPDLKLLILQIVPAYGVIIAFAGWIIALCTWMIFQRRSRIRGYLPLAWFPALVLIEFWGLNADPAPTCRLTQGMPPRYSIENPDDLLIITLDTCRADYLGAYGNAMIKTPMMDRLARQGVTVEQAIAPIPITTSSHATIFTGQDPPEHGSRFNAVPINVESSTIAEIFRDHGYRTGAFVSAFPLVHDVSGLGRGFDIYDQLLTPSKLHPLVYRTMMTRGLTRFGPFRPAERKWFRVIPSVKKWWSMADSSPRFTWVHLYDPHFPYQPGFPFEKMYLDNAPRYYQSVFDIAEINQSGKAPEQDKINEFNALYASEISAVDHAIEELIRALNRENRLKNTHIVLTADHGESLDEHSYYFSHGDNLFDPSVHVPLIAVYPGRFQKDRVIAGQMRLASLAGTIFASMGLTTPIDSLSDEIRSVFEGRHDTLPPDDAFCETGSGVYTTVHVPSQDRIRLKQRAIRSDGIKVIYKNDADILGFRLDFDPGEVNPESIMNQPEWAGLVEKLKNYINESDSPGKTSAGVPDENTLQQLQLLGYMD